MQQLLQLMGRYRVVLTFVGLQLICFWLIIQQNRHQSATVFTSANYVSVQGARLSSYVTEYFGLKQQNTSLVAQNKRLLEELSQLTVSSNPKDSVHLPGYQFIVGKVMNNSVMHAENYLLIDKGKLAGVEPGMGVVSPDGVVGKVKMCNDHYSIVYSFLHPAITISAKIPNKGILGSVKWDKKDYRFGQLLFVPRDIKVEKGDTVLATGYSSIYPENYPIGTVSAVSLQGTTSFLDIKVQLSTKFASLNYVYVIKNPIQKELDSLQQNGAPEHQQQ